MTRHALPLQPVLVTFPTALWIFGFACDLASLLDRENALWPAVAFYALAAGVIAGIATAVPEWFDFASLRRGQMRAAATRQLLVNMAVLVIFAVDVGARLADVFGLLVPVAISLGGVLFLGIAGRLGGDPVYVRTAIAGREAGVSR